MYFEIGGTNSRLLGSLHAWPADSGPNDLPEWVWEAYRRSDVVYFEHDFSEVESSIRLPAGVTLQDLLPASVWATLTGLLPPGADLSPLTPWAAFSMLQFIGTPIVKGVESQLLARARIDSKPIHYLEALREFTGPLDAAISANNWEVFVAALAGLEDYRRVVRDMRNVWLSRRVEDVEAVLPRTLLGMPSLARVTLDNRNLAWVPRIEAAVRAPERTLIVVGAAHLPRATGLLRLLEQRGHEIRDLRHSIGE